VKARWLRNPKLAKTGLQRQEGGSVKDRGKRIKEKLLLAVFVCALLIGGVSVPDVQACGGWWDPCCPWYEDKSKWDPSCFEDEQQQERQPIPDKRNAWSKGVAESSAFPLQVWAGTTGIAAALTADPPLGVIAGALGLLSLLADKMAKDPPDCTNGIQKPDFSNVIPVDTSLTGRARLASAIQFNVGRIVALGEAAITAQNRVDCPTRSDEGIIRQYNAAQGFTHRMGVRLIVLHNQMVRAGDIIERRGVLSEEELGTLEAGERAAAIWAESLATGETD